MKILAIYLLAVFGETLTDKISYRNYKVYRITPKDEVSLQTLKDMEELSTELSAFSFWNGPSKVGNSVDLMVSPALNANIEHMLESLNVESLVLIEDVQKRIDAESPPSLTRANTFSGNWTRYSTLEEINSWLEELSTTYQAVTLLNPGKSHEGRDIIGVKLDFGGAENKKAVFMESNIHAREWITSAVNTYILNEFLTSENTTIRTLAEKYTWYFFPVMNPDGFEYSHTNDRMWRKTRTRYNIFCYGADPNRNWGYRWMTGGASQNPCSDLYAGPEPFSEPSVKVMQTFISSIANDLIAYLDFHSYSQMLLLPYGHTTDHLENYDEMMQIGNAAMDRLKARYNTEYVVGNIAETIYVATGSSMDWVKGTYNTTIAYCYELRDKGQYGFVLPANQIIPTAEETLDSVIAIFEEYEKLYPNN